jgi:hypothetical protein
MSLFSRRNAIQPGMTFGIGRSTLSAPPPELSLGRRTLDLSGTRPMHTAGRQTVRHVAPGSAPAEGADQGGRLAIAVMKAAIQFESWIREHLFSHKRISRGIGLLLMAFNEFAAE